MTFRSSLLLTFVVLPLSALVAKAGYVFTTIDIPGAVGGSFQYGTHAVGINVAGQITGYYADNNGQHGFVRSPGGAITTFDFPGTTYTRGYGVNAAGQIVGFFINETPGVHGFLDNGGVFTQFDNPGAPLQSLIGTEASGINAAGQIVGIFATTLSGRTQGFLAIGGAFTTISVPGATGDTWALGINDTSQIVGWYQFNNFVTQYAFLDVNGIYTTINVPGSFNTRASAINNSGQIVGDFCDGTVCHGYLDTNGTFTTIDAPGAAGYTGPLGINDAGQIVGEFVDAGGSAHGFLATPTPEPSSWLLAGVGVVALARRRSKKLWEALGCRELPT